MSRARASDPARPGQHGPYPLTAPTPTAVGSVLEDGEGVSMRDGGRDGGEVVGVKVVVLFVWR